MPVRIRAKENVCMICGQESTGRKHIRASKNDNEFIAEIPLCEHHRGLPDSILLKAFEASLEQYAAQVEQEASGPGMDLDDLTLDEVREVGRKFRDAPCLVCDKPKHDMIRKIPHQGKVAILPLCSSCAVASDKILTESVEFLNATFETRPSC